MSSTDVIRVFKRRANFEGKIGHAGTLDVFAQGIVILMLGKGTKKFDEIQMMDKTYQAGARLGYSSDTLDIEGVLLPQVDAPPTSFLQIEEALQPFIGEYEQAIPRYSAAKQDGQPLYKLARENKEIKPKSKPVKIYDIELQDYMHPLVTMEVRCSSGTYIRQLTHDIFSSLELESFLFYLRRTQIGDIVLDSACELSEFADDQWQQYVLPL